MSNNWTNEQLDAINKRDCNLLVAAAAGAGKTAVLVERIIRKITDTERPVDIDKLLVVTFTNAAATEMQERIGDALADALERNPSSENLQKQMALLDRASIMTLHSFCLEVVRNHFHSLDLDPAFRIADETESMLLKLDALEKLFEEEYDCEEMDSDFFKLVESYGRGRDDGSLREIVLSLHRFTLSHPWPEQWLAAQTEAYSPDASVCLSSTPWGGVLLKSAVAELQGLTALLEKATAAARRGQGLEPYLSVLEADKQQLEELERLCCAAYTAGNDTAVSPNKAPDVGQDCSGWDTVHFAFSSYQPARLPRCGKDADKDAQEEVKAARNIVKEKVRKLPKEGFDASEAEIKRDFATLYPLFKHLSQMVCRFNEIYSQKKKDKSLLDFNDLEHYCLEVLLKDGMPTEAAKELRQGFEEVMVDEYQDSNLIQELILTTISGNQDDKYNMFMVGDVKQSIYRFRQAKPELFLSKYEAYPREDGQDSKVIQLYKNFRSRHEIINGVNFVFEQIMSGDVGEIEYNHDEALNPGAVFKKPECDCNVGGAIELHILDVTSSETEILSASNRMEHNNDECGITHEEDVEAEEEAGGEETDREPLDNIQAEARIIGERIRSLVSKEKGFCIFDKKLDGYRNAEYRDIVILMRATRGRADIFADELAAMGIPVYADTGLGYFNTVEVETMLSLLKIIDNPLQDIPMLAVLRSPIGSFSADELADIRLTDKSVSIFEAMKLCAGQSNKKAADFLTRLESWRDISQYTSTDDLVWRLLKETGYLSYVGILPGGAERQANLRMLFERARQFEETSYKGLFNFVNFIGRLRSGGGDMGSAKIIGENENVVRIMSIHKSKGLEFPVVFVAGCSKKFNLRDLNEGILLHQELGFGSDVVNLEKRTIAAAMPKFAIRKKLRLESLSEEMRILYVAFTRAKEKLILTGCVKELDKACSKWCSGAETEGIKLPSYDVQQATSFLDWIAPAVARHESGKPLRMLAGGLEKEVHILKDNDSMWEVRLWGMGAVFGDEKAEAALEDVKEWLEEGSLDIEDKNLVQKLEWQYPYKALTTVPAKISVTELKRRFADESETEAEASRPFANPIVGKPLFMETDTRLDAARKGTVMHFVMQHVDFKSIKAAIAQEQSKGEKGKLQEVLEKQLSEMVEKEQLTNAEAEVVNIKGIEAFFNTHLGGRVLSSDTVQRETTFNVEINATDVYKELPHDLFGSEMLLLQGVIDCWFETEKGIVLIDYKTDYVPKGGEDIIKKRYSVQLDYYTRALEKITGREVAEKYLYLFYNGELLKC